eukprot:1262577-Prymnesium_polylepis.1
MVQTPNSSAIDWGRRPDPNHPFAEVCTIPQVAALTATWPPRVPSTSGWVPQSLRPDILEACRPRKRLCRCVNLAVAPWCFMATLSNGFLTTREESGLAQRLGETSA